VNLTKDTEGIIGERELAMMKPGSLLVNGGRGTMVDKYALINALNSGHLGGAAIDTYEQEPLPADDPILGCEQVVLTPHLADQTPEGIESLNEGIITNTIAYLEGHPQNIANPPAK
jgi:phosphoglycerate dehydrogenase-like enzyme